MELGVDRHRGWRRFGIAGAIVFGLVALIDLAGTSYALLAPGYVFEDGEIPGEITVFVVGAALSLGCALLAKRHGGPPDDAVDPEHWLPPLTAPNGEGQVDLGVETARLRPLAFRARALVFVWLLVFVGAVLGFGGLSASSEHLLASGTRVTGNVLSVFRPSRGRGSSTLYVDYEVNGDLKFAEIIWDSDRKYVQGQPITVIYDPADPTRVRTPDETNNDQFWVWVCVIGLVAGLGGIPFSIVAAGKWRRRYRAVLRTGWRIASVTVVPDYPVRKGRHMPDIHVEYRDGSGITLRAASSSHGSVPLKDRPNRRAWIGGTGKDMVVLFPHGRWRTPPYAVPAYALTTRRPQPRSPVT